MPGHAYIDSSALLKLAFPEPETSALEADLAARDGLLSSRLTAVECARALTREMQREALYSREELLGMVLLLDITPTILEQAADVTPPVLRSLDAIQLATILSVGDPTLEVITYDRRLAAAAQAHGLAVVQPGRPSQA